MDIELCVDAMELAPHIDQMVLFSGDGDFRSLVGVQCRGVRVTVGFLRLHAGRQCLPMNFVDNPIILLTLSNSNLKLHETIPVARPVNRATRRNF